MLALLDQPHVLLLLLVQEGLALFEILSSFPDIAALSSDLFGRLLDLVEESEPNHGRSVDDFIA